MTQMYPDWHEFIVRNPMMTIRWTNAKNPPFEFGSYLVVYVDKGNRNYIDSEDGFPWQIGVGQYTRHYDFEAKTESFSKEVRHWNVYEACGAQVHKPEVLYYIELHGLEKEMQSHCAVDTDRIR